MRPNPGRASPMPSEQPLKLSTGYFISENDFILQTRTRHQTFILLPVRETKEAWRAINCLHCKMFYLQVQPEEKPGGFQKDVFVHRTRKQQIGNGLRSL